MSVYRRGMRIAPGLLGFALLAACTSEFTFSDSVNSRLFEIKPRAEFGDELSTPYVIGAEFEVFVEDNEQETDFVGWKIESTNPKVLRLRDEPYRIGDHIIGLDVAAAGEGTAELLLRDNFGEIRGTAAVEVLRPTRAKLFAAPVYALENPDFRGETARPRILAGGTATFAVEYLHDDIRLQGATTIRAEGTDALDAAVRSSEVAHNRNWVQFTPVREGEHTAELWLGERMVESVTIDGVGPGAIFGVELIHSDPATPDELAGEWLLVAQAVSEDKVPVYGVDFEWMLEERGAYVVPGDVFLYEHDEEEKFRRVTARAYGVETTISVRIADGEPASSNDTAMTCSVSGSSCPVWALSLVLLGFRRRRR